jgi:hypothetical protein
MLANGATAQKFRGAIACGRPGDISQLLTDVVPACALVIPTPAANHGFLKVKKALCIIVPLPHKRRKRRCPCAPGAGQSDNRN